MDSSENRVYVIKCDTGVGKTEELLNQNLDGVCVAFDTHRLKNEAYSRLLERGKEAYLWPKPPPLPEAQTKILGRCHTIGLAGTKKAYEQALETEEVFVDIEWASSIREYLNALSDIHTQSSIVTTHEKAFQLQRNAKVHTFVFDEDITKTLIRMEEVKLEDIEKFRQIICERGGEQYVQIDEHLKSIVAATSRVTHEQSTVTYSAELLQELLLQTPQSFDSPIEALFSCIAYRKDASVPDSAERVFCISRQNLRKDRKYIVLSATADELVYRQLFGDRLEFINLSGTELKGALICHTGHSYSKQSIAEDFPAFLTKVQRDMAKYEFDGIITHKFCAGGDNGDLYLKGTEGTVPIFGTFGGLQGLDSFGGRNIAVYGTPYPPEYAVKLWTVALGWNVDETIYEFRERTLELDEYEVSVATCSADTNIQHIYLWLAYSEIVQAVGRARLVNNDCTVHVFAKLPISGCALMN